MLGPKLKEDSRSSDCLVQMPRKISLLEQAAWAILCSASLSLPRENLESIQLKLWLEESFKNLFLLETSAKRMIICIVQTIFIRYAMELGNPNLD